MKIPFINSTRVSKSPVKITWTIFKEISGPKIFDTFTLQNKKAGDVFVKVKEHKDGFNRFRIEIENKFGKSMGKEIFAVDEKNKSIFGFSIAVEPEYRRKKYKFGEIIRLASIMELVENKGPHIKIYSKDTAVFFHSKYKFEPNIRTFEDRDKALRTIALDNAVAFGDFAKSAKEIISKIEINKGDAQAQRDLCKPTNELVKKYIERALQDKEPDKLHQFERGMDMILRSEVIAKNKDFFNQLFKKHGIDYIIKDPQ